MRLLKGQMGEVTRGKNLAVEMGSPIILSEVCQRGKGNQSVARRN